MTTTKPVRLLISALAAAITCAAALTAAPAFAQAVIVAPLAPPPPRVEVMPAPRAGYAWDPGHWRWAEGRYVWVGGHWNWAEPNYVWVPGVWQRPLRAHSVWVAPEWRHHSLGWWRVAGHWR